MEVEPFITFSPSFRVDRPTALDRSVFVNQYLAFSSVTTPIHLCKSKINDENGYRWIGRRVGRRRTRRPRV
jgi:hypothetical protein